MRDLWWKLVQFFLLVLLLCTVSIIPQMLRVPSSINVADFSGRAFQVVGLWPIACWDRGFESRQGHGCLSVVIVVCCQVLVSATS